MKVKACYFKKVGLVDFSPCGGKIKFEFLVLKFKFYFPAKRTQVNKADDFHKIMSLYLWYLKKQECIHIPKILLHFRDKKQAFITCAVLLN